MKCVFALFFFGSFVNFGPDNGVVETGKKEEEEEKEKEKEESPLLCLFFPLPLYPKDFPSRFFVVLLKEKRTHFTFP